MPGPSAAMSEYAPRIYTLHIPTDKIRDVIGPGGKVIRGIIEQTGVKIDVEDDGTIHVASADEASANRAIQIISDLTATAEVGKTYLGKVVRLAEFRAFVELLPWYGGWISDRPWRSSREPTVCCTSARSRRTRLSISTTS